MLSHSFTANVLELDTVCVIDETDHGSLLHNFIHKKEPSNLTRAS